MNDTKMVENVLDRQIQRIRLLDVRDLSALTGLAERTIWRLSGTGDFPAPITIGNSRKLKKWRYSDVESYLQKLSK